MARTLDDLQRGILGGAYATERKRRIKAATLPLVDESPIYLEEQREVRYQGIREHITGRKLSVSVHERMRQAAKRVRQRETKG